MGYYMSLTIFGTDPCWSVLQDQLQKLHPHLFEKNIALFVNCQNMILGAKNIIWLHESPAIVQNVVEQIKTNPSYFEKNKITVEEHSLLKRVKDIGNDEGRGEINVTEMGKSFIFV